MAIAYLFVTCADCGAEVDRLEFEPDTDSAAVLAVVGATGLDRDAAAKLVAKHNPGAELTSEEATRQLGDAIVAGKVDGRPVDADRCPIDAEHSGLQVQNDNPTPAVTLRIQKVSA